MYSPAKLVFIENTLRVPKNQEKDQVDSIAKLNDIYGFVCFCRWKYADRTSGQVATRNNEYVAASFRKLTRQLQEARHIVELKKTF